MSDDRVNASYESIAAFEEAIGRFGSKTRDGLKRADHLLRRATGELQRRRDALRSEIRSLEEEIANAGEDDDTSSATHRLEEASTELANVHRWQASVAECAQRYRSQALALERVCSETTPKVRLYLRGLLDDLSSYFALQADESPSTGSAGFPTDSRDERVDEPQHSSGDVATSADTDSAIFRERQGVLALEAKTKDYESRCRRYPELRALTPEEYLAINRYTQFDFENINNELRRGASDRQGDWGAHTRIATRGLAKLPVWTGTVFRGTDNQPFVDAYAPGAIVTELGFTSTSRVPEQAKKNSVRFEIQSKNGRDISSCSAMQSETAREGEVLFAPNTQFEVLERFTENQTTTIRMREV